MTMLDTPVLVLKLIKVIISFGTDVLLSKIWSIVHRFTYKEAASPKNVVIIGGSFAGCEAAKSLVNSLPTGYRVILVEKSSHFQFTWNFPRFFVVSGHEHKAFIPYDHLADGAPRGSFRRIQDTVDSISKTAVSLKSGPPLKYEYLIIATGSTAGPPSRLNVNDKADGIELLNASQQSIADADRLVVVGGGPAGVELAFDAKMTYPSKEVALVHSRRTLLQNFDKKLHVAALEALENAGIRVILNQRVKTESKTEVTLSSGEQVPCDLVIKCTGQKAASNIVAELSPDSLSPSGGYIKVKKTLQIADEKLSHIYVAGDVADIDGGPKNGHAATMQAMLVSNNIVRAIKSKTLLDYRVNSLIEGGIELTLGLENNVIYFTDGKRDALIDVKSKDIALKAASCWKRMGAKPYVDDGAKE